MKCILCKNKTVEERLTATNRMIKVVLAFMLITVGIVVYEMISMVIGDRTAFNHTGQICSTLGVLVCTYSLNIKNKKEFEAELANAVEEK